MNHMMLLMSSAHRAHVQLPEGSTGQGKVKGHSLAGKIFTHFIVRKIHGMKTNI